MINRLFVYGTLCPGRLNEHILTTIGGLWEEGSVVGILHQEGWGAAMGYPGIVLDMDGGNVEGFVFSSDNLVGHWGELDAFEGEGYERVVTSVELRNGAVVDAYVYTLRRSNISL